MGAAEQASKEDSEVAGVRVDEEDALDNALDIVEEAEEAEQHMDAGRVAGMVMDVDKAKKACTAMGTARGSA